VAIQTNLDRFASSKSSHSRDDGKPQEEVAGAMKCPEHQTAKNDQRLPMAQALGVSFFCMNCPAWKKIWNKG
jgi:hypothetical protein